MIGPSGEFFRGAPVHGSTSTIHGNDTMKKLLLPMLLAALALAGCGGEEPAPAPEATSDAAPVAEATPTPAATPEPPPPPPKTAVINNEQIGVEPPKNIQDAFNTANKAMDLYCQNEGMDRSTFYIKATDQLPDRWRVTFFGAPGGVAMYVYVDVWPDGRFEFQR